MTQCVEYRTDELIRREPEWEHDSYFLVVNHFYVDPKNPNVIIIQKDEYK